MSDVRKRVERAIELLGYAVPYGRREGMKELRALLASLDEPEPVEDALFIHAQTLFETWIRGGRIGFTVGGDGPEWQSDGTQDDLVTALSALTALAPRSGETYTLDEIKAGLKSADVGGWAPGTFHIWWPRFCAALGVRHISMLATRPDPETPDSDV